MRKATIFGSILLLAAAFQPASATTVLPIRDGSLADQATVIAQGTVIGSGPAADRPATEYRLRVEQLLKGDVPGGTLVVRVPGGAAANGLKLKIWGAPEFHIGERALLFLVANPDGSYGPLHLALGAFHELRSEASRLAIRDLSEVYQVGADGSPEPLRDMGRFSRWLADRAAGVERDADYFVAAPQMKQAWGAFTYLGGIKQRWLEFDRGQDVLWKAQESGQPGLPGGGFAEFQAGLNAWNAEPATNIRYKWDGTTTTTTGFQHPDGINAILFEDPNSEAPGSFSCPRPGSGEGVLAIGGSWYDDETSPATIGEGDIVVNDGASCWFTSGKRAEQVYGHELGHTLGLGHSCGDARGGPCDTTVKNEALMRANAHSDNRGAQLNADDRAGILSLYPGSDGSGNRPAAPSDLTAEVVSSRSVTLTWTDNSGNETQFFVEMKKGAKFKVVTKVKANVTTVTLTGLTPGKALVFRVKAKNKKVVSEASNEVVVEMPS